MKILLLCGYRTETAMGLEPTPTAQTLIDQRLAELKTLGLTAVAVLAGPNADEQLRASRKLMDAELAFDDSAHVNLVTNVRAGLKLNPNEPCFVIPVEIPVPTREVWQTMAAATAGEHAIVQPLDTEFGFPLLVTRAGSDVIRRTPDLESLLDARLPYHHLSLVASQA